MYGSTFGVRYVYTFWYVFEGYRLIDRFAVPWYDDGGDKTGYTESYSANNARLLRALKPLDRRRVLIVRRYMRREVQGGARIYMEVSRGVPLSSTAAHDPIRMSSLSGRAS